MLEASARRTWFQMYVASLLNKLWFEIWWSNFICSKFYLWNRILKLNSIEKYISKSWGDIRMLYAMYSNLLSFCQSIGVYIKYLYLLGILRGRYITFYIQMLILPKLLHASLGYKFPSEITQDVNETLLNIFLSLYPTN